MSLVMSVSAARLRNVPNETRRLRSGAARLRSGMARLRSARVLTLGSDRSTRGVVRPAAIDLSPIGENQAQMELALCKICKLACALLKSRRVICPADPGRSRDRAKMISDGLCAHCRAGAEPRRA